MEGPMGRIKQLIIIPEYREAASYLAVTWRMNFPAKRKFALEANSVNHIIISAGGNLRKFQAKTRQ